MAKIIKTAKQKLTDEEMRLARYVFSEESFKLIARRPQKDAPTPPPENPPKK